jgi:hypothetical protein
MPRQDTIDLHKEEAGGSGMNGLTSILKTIDGAD